jgi:hypothetical protein
MKENKKIQRRKPPKKIKPKIDPTELSEKAISYLLEMANVLGSVKPRWRRYEERLADWGVELVRLHDLFEKEIKGEGNG